MGKKTPISPIPKGKRPITGTAQCTCLSAAQPYQKKDKGTMNPMILQGSNLISGSNTSLLSFKDLFNIVAERTPCATSPMTNPNPIERYTRLDVLIDHW